MALRLPAFAEEWSETESSRSRAVKQALRQSRTAAYDNGAANIGDAQRYFTKEGGVVAESLIVSMFGEEPQGGAAFMGRRRGCAMQVNIRD